MINEIFVNGFKSLNGFKLQLYNGLNILVGPNGSGKTNIITFFEFLGDLQGMSVSDAVSNAGGAGTVFTKIGKNSYNASIDCVINGNTQLTKRKYLFYSYTFEINIDKSAEFITYSSQRLQVKYRTVVTKNKSDIKNYDLDIQVSTNEEGRINVKIRKIDRRKIKTRYRFPPVQEKQTRTEIIKHIERILKDFYLSEESLMRGLHYVFEDSFYIRSDLKGGKVFNVVPSRAKIPEDSAKPPGISKDGSGLYATLYAAKKMQKMKKKPPRFYLFREQFHEIETSISDILKYVRLANESIIDIDVFNDPFNNQINIHISLKGKSEDTIFPLSAISDGTIKWLLLITIVLSTPSLFSIEEPENYLHPLMQAEILSVMRSTLKNKRAILLSTHSETILNNASPDEIVVVSFSEGNTDARRPTNAEELSQEIKETGFGLGYYYIAGSLDDE